MKSAAAPVHRSAAGAIHDEGRAPAAALAATAALRGASAMIFVAS
jgi:hypothetical protein